MKRVLLLLVACVFVVAVPAACGGEDDETATPETVEGTQTETGGGGAGGEGNAENGKSVFASAGCGGCHTFEPAGSSGTVGPNLDDADVSFDAAVAQITDGGGGMPAFGDRLSEEEIRDVAAFVSQG